MTIRHVSYWLCLVVILLTGISHAQDASWGTDNPQGSLRLLLNGIVSHRVPGGLPGVLAVPVQRQHPPPPPEGEVYYYLMPNGVYLLTAGGTPQLVGPAVTAPAVHAKLILTTAQSLPPRTDTLIQWSKAQWDTAGFYDGSAPGHIQIRQGGTYALLCGLQFQQTAKGVMEIYARKGHGEEIGRDSKAATHDRDTRVGLEIEDIFAAGETLEVYGSHTAAEAINVMAASGTFCSVKKTG
jgi:hypothetical protein